MSERLNPVAIIFAGVILCGLCWISGKHSADRWFATHATKLPDCPEGHVCALEGETFTIYPNRVVPPAPADIDKPQAAVALGHIEGFPDGCYKVSEDRMRVEIIQCPSSAHPLKLGKRKPALQVEWQEDCKIDEQCPPSTANEVEPTWSTNAHWQQYPIPPYWTCPAGYEQVTGNERFSASKPGEMASGSEDHAHKPKCLLPGVSTPQVPQ